MRDRQPEDEYAEGERMVLSDLVNRVLDKGVVIHGNVLISIADVDLIRLDLTVVISSVEADLRRRRRLTSNGDLSVLPPAAGR
jgi:hypothetical protein